MPEAPEIKPAITWSRSLFHEGSIGVVHFPEVLEGRIRHLNSANLEVAKFVYKAYLDFFNTRGTLTLLDLLKFSDAAFKVLISQPARRSDFHFRLVDYLDQLAVSPESRLLHRLQYDIFGAGRENPTPVPVEFEPKIRERIYADLRVVGLRQKSLAEIIDVKYGLAMGFGPSDGLPKSIKQTAKIFQMSEAVVFNKERKALKGMGYLFVEKYHTPKQFFDSLHLSGSL